MRFRLFLGCVILVMVLAGTNTALSADLPHLNSKVIAFCEKNLNKTVGNGECAALAFRALEGAGAKTRGGPDFPEKGDYVWGKQVYMYEASDGGPKTSGAIADILPGDIIQFRDTTFAKCHFHHHTAVVRDTDHGNKRIRTYQQNANGNRFVTEGAVVPDTLSTGWIRVYRPVR